MLWVLSVGRHVSMAAGWGCSFSSASTHNSREAAAGPALCAGFALRGNAIQLGQSGALVRVEVPHHHHCKNLIVITKINGIKGLRSMAVEGRAKRRQKG